jgi:homoserine O-acetyltransferase
MILRRPTSTMLLFVIVRTLCATDYPVPAENDYAIRHFKFASSETLPELRIHYRTIGKTEQVKIWR